MGAKFDADVVVIATGFKPPDMSFLPKELFPEGYDVGAIHICLCDQANMATSSHSALICIDRISLPRTGQSCLPIPHTRMP